MLQNWLAFLQDQGARIENGAVEGFSDPHEEARAAVEGDVIADLSHFGLIRAEGDDAVNFLQGQFSNDVRQVTDDFSQLSSYCSPKGRMLASFRLFRHDGAFFIRLPSELVEPTLGRLKKYVLMAKVTLEDNSGDLLRLGVSGPNAPARLQSAGLPTPEQPDETAHAHGTTVLRTPGTFPRYEIYAAPERMEALWMALAADMTPIGRSAWALLDIRNGVPTVFPATEEAFVPQMANMQLLGGVSFKKGCYPGQEVVARMQYLGKLKRRMYLAHVESDARPAPGEEVYAPDEEQGVGKIVDAQPAAGSGYDLLAVIQIPAAREGDIRVGAKDGPRAEFHELPYAFEEQ